MRKKEKKIPRVRAVRLLLGLTQREAADAAGLGIRWYKRWDSEGLEPAPERVEALSKAWRTSPLYGEVPDLPYKEIGRLVESCGGRKRLLLALGFLP